MIRAFLFRLRAAWLFSRIQPHIPRAPEWSDADARILSNFLTRTDTGKKYRMLLWYSVQSSGFSAVLDRNHTVYECGYAAGARGLCSVADSLLQVKAEEEPEPIDDGNPLFNASPEVKRELERLQP